MTVVDASALLAFVQGEPGADVVETALIAGARCSAANWSEVAQKVLAADRDWPLVRSLLASYAIEIDPVLAVDAEWAAHRWRRNENLSLADRLCLALASRSNDDVLTADAAWADEPGVRVIR